MSIKEDLKAVKDELSAEEQFLEGLIRAERFYKKYKKPLIALFAIIAILFVGYSVKTYIDESNLIAANEAYLKLLKDPQDKTALDTLKNKNLNLYYAFRFKIASKNNDKAIFKEIISNAKDRYLVDLSKYQLSSLDAKRGEIEDYIDNSSPGLLKNLALLDDAYLLLKENKKNEAKIKLSSIEVDSPLKNIAKNFEHYIK